LNGIEHNIGFRTAGVPDKWAVGGRQRVGIDTGNRGDPKIRGRRVPTAGS